MADLYNQIYTLPVRLDKARARYLLYIKQAKELACSELLTERDLANLSFEDEVARAKREAAEAGHPTSLSDLGELHDIAELGGETAEAAE